MTVPTTLIKVCIVVFPMRRPFSVDMATLRWAPPFYQPPCSQAPWNATSCPTSASPPPPLPLSSYGNLTESSLNCQESLVVIFDKNLICQNSRIVQKISDGIVVARELISKINMNFFPSFFFILSSSRGIASKFQRSEYSKKKNHTQIFMYAFKPPTIPLPPYEFLKNKLPNNLYVISPLESKFRTVKENPGVASWKFQKIWDNSFNLFSDL